MQQPKQKSIVEKIAASGTIITSIILSLGAFRMLLWGERYNIAILNYLNFSNLLDYSFGITRTLVVIMIIPVTVFLAFKRARNINIEKLSWFVGILICIPCAFICIAYAFIVWRYYEHPKYFTITQQNSLFLIYLTAAGLFAFWVFVTKWNFIDKQPMKVFLFALFLFSFVKINTRAEISSMENNRKKFYNVIIYRDTSRKSEIISGKKYIAATTNDFIFVQDDSTHSITAIPTSEIHSISTDSIMIKR